MCKFFFWRNLVMKLKSTCPIIIIIILTECTCYVGAQFDFCNEFYIFVVAAAEICGCFPGGGIN